MEKTMMSRNEEIEAKELMRMMGHRTDKTMSLYEVLEASEEVRNGS